MRNIDCFQSAALQGVRNLGGCLLIGVLFFTFGCAHKKAATAPNVYRPISDELKPVKVDGPIVLRLKADLSRSEKVAYLHRSSSQAFEDGQVRSQKEESAEFTSQAETVKVEPADANNLERFTQAITVVHKDGPVNMHDFAMPEPGERLEVTADSTGKILKSGDYPPNSLFYVSPVSLPAGPVGIGDTWTMQASWLSLEEMIPFQLDMVSILKGIWQCGKDRCAEIELSGDVGLQGPLTRTMSFASHWRGTIFFALNAGTVVWSRVDSEERMIAENVRREVDSCLSAVLVSPDDLKIPGVAKPNCDTKTPSL